jgi:putative N6-adenine-specific DNA methylase
MKVMISFLLVFLIGFIGILIHVNGFFLTQFPIASTRKHKTRLFSQQSPPTIISSTKPTKIKAYVPSNYKRRNFYATTTVGAENVLKEELEKLSDVKDLKIEIGAVSFSGTTKSALDGLLWLRSCLKLYEEIDTSHLLGDEDDGQIYIYTKDQLYEFVSLIDWSKMIRVESSIKCSCLITDSSLSSDLNHSHFSALTIKAAICDHFNSRVGSRPSISLEDPTLFIFLYLHKNRVKLYRAWSGVDSLHKRGYRENMPIHKASMKSTLAHSM